MPKRKKEASLNLPNPFAIRVKAGPNKEVEASFNPKNSNQSLEKSAEVSNDALNKIADEDAKFDLFVGTSFGVLKGVGFGGEIPISKNFYHCKDLTPSSPSVVSLTWADEFEKELVVAFSNHVVKTYNTKLRCFTRQTPLSLVPENQKLVGLCCNDEASYVYGQDDGKLVLWDVIESKPRIEISTGDCMSKLVQCPWAKCRNFYATGGKENDLKIWDMSSEKPTIPFFKARNVPHDELDLRVPVWVQDMTFLPGSHEVVAVGTRYGQVRLYDVRAGLRSVSNVKFLDQPIMAISSTMDERQVIVGTGHGEAGRFDLRNPGKERLLKKYLGHSGSIRHIVASRELPYFVSCGLDRHLYLHEFSTRTPIKKLYMKQQLNCIAISKTFMKNINDSNDKHLIGKDTRGSNIDAKWSNVAPDVLEISPKKKNRKSSDVIS